MIRVELPWPDKAISPNGRAHWAQKAKAAKSAKNAAFYLAWAQAGAKLPWASVKLHWIFHPKTRHPVDADNCVASCKAFQDGIAMAIGVDDAKFQTTYSIGAPVKGGAVIVTIEEAK